MAAMYFFAPAYKTKIADSTVNYAYSAIKDKLVTDLDIYYVRSPKPDGSQSNVAQIEINKNSIVEDYHGEDLHGMREGEKICFDRQEELTLIYASEDIDPNVLTAGCPSNAISAKISSSISEKVISELKAKNLNNTDYNQLKQILNIPAGRDFTFNLRFENGEEIGISRNIPRGLNVFSKSERLKVIRIDGRREFADLIVRIW